MRGNLFTVVLLTLFVSGQSHAAGTGDFLGGSFLNFSAQELQQYIPKNTVNALVKTMGLYIAHRPYQGASIMGGTQENSGNFEFGLETTLVKFSPIIFDAMVADGFSQSAPADIPGLPMIKFHMGLALASKYQINLSTLYYPGNYVIGADFQSILWDTGEGPLVSGRLSYNYADLPLAYTAFSTWSPAIIVGRPMSFADPYIGAQYYYMTGKLQITVDQPPFPVTKVTTGGKSDSWSAFTGVVFRMPIFSYFN
jgi:hypothetical protein